MQVRVANQVVKAKKRRKAQLKSKEVKFLQVRTASREKVRSGVERSHQ